MPRPRQPVKKSVAAGLSWPGAIGIWLLLLMAGLLGATRDVSSLILTLPDAVFLLGLWGGILLAGGVMAWGLLGLLGKPPAAGHLLWGLTCLLLGGWLLSLLMLVLGSLGLMGPMIIPTLLLVTALVGGMALYRRRERIASAWAKRAGRVTPGILLVGGVAALSAGLWLAGAMRPPWFVGMPGDGYDVTLYHLQVPREYLLAGHIHELQHNVYSYYPMQMEMHYLLGMNVAAGFGADGMYQAKIIHGLYGFLAAGVLLSMFGRRRRLGLWAALLLVTSPMVLRLGWVAMVELGEFAYLALALAWLKRWWRVPRWQYALLVGLALGASCCVKYLSVGFIVAPILLVMGLRVLGDHRRARLGQVGLALGVAAVLFCPWLVRNMALTGNPVFPLATDLLGRGHWSQEEQKRWIQGHRPGDHPRVPEPSVPLAKREDPGRLEQFAGGLRDKLFNPALMAVGLLSAGWALLAWSRRRRSFPAALAVILSAQLGVWALATHRMPPRFLSPALVVICLLAAEGIDAARNRLRPSAPGAGTAAVALLCSIGLAIAVWIFDTTARGPQGYVPPAPREDVARWTLPEIYGEGPLPPPGRVLMIGEAPAFYYPQHTVYSTPFDTRELLKYLKPEATPAERLAHLQSRGIRRILVNWSEIRRLAATYGYPEVLSHDVLEAAAQGQPPRLGIIEELEPLGLRIEFDRIADHRPPDRRYATATLYVLP